MADRLLVLETIAAIEARFPKTTTFFDIDNWIETASPKRVFLLTDELKSLYAKEAASKALKNKKATNAREWNSAYPEDIQAAVKGIMAFYPKKGVQPNSDNQPIPNTSAPLLASRIAAIKAEGGDLFIVLAIAKRYVDEWKNGEHWIKAAQFFFGAEGPWKDYYQAEVTNRQMGQ